jgi:hypothetical protein
MNHSSRLPRAGVDPVDAAAALAVIDLAVHCPPIHHETVVLLLDQRRCGLGITVVAGTRRPDDVIDVAEVVARSGSASPGLLQALVIATVRPGGGLLPDDADRWLEMSALAAAHGLTVIEWFVLGVTTECPRDLLGEPPRW